MRKDTLTKIQRKRLNETLQYLADLVKDGYRIDDFIVEFKTIDTGEIALVNDVFPEKIEYRKMNPSTMTMKIDITYSPDEQVEGCNTNLNKVE